ncbi:MAG TPA: hypothetical protein VHH88_02595 [Verrucomicrobiae bacterium]|nr:hypothetical protein [Verrucomicrobiae bacterium]
MTSSSYVIQWKSKVNGRAGRGTKEFDREEAERLALELNQEYPQIHHEPVAASTEAPASEKASHDESSYALQE